ncbi:8-amino-7-oxononanoate synthase [uncultured Victivallis sp.]|uniref:aminotransferase class I/II-fold pyridoxal phosphate-dependent enzyme n=1 Tax=uncultured Victivallis sp. TaxID=354118 RepID=UPI0025FBB5AE|nr:8-amino-7-oxononanoate synthase [uncultured Victivallis sp.]
MGFREELAADAAQLESGGRLRILREIAPEGHGLCRCDGRTYWNFSSNDYMGIAADAELRKRFYAEYPDTATPELALSSASSRLLTGNTPAYTRLEAKLSERYNHRAALVFNSGYHANIGILPALASKEDLILSDKLNHASIIDGMRLADAEFRRYPHLDCDRLEAILRQKRADYRRVFLVTESVFSMDGDTADLRRLVELKKLYDCILVVDEAHSVGVRGPKGTGLAAELGIADEIDVLIGTFGKAFGSTGAYAIMAPETRTYLINHMRPLIFTTGLPPAVLNWSCFVLDRCAEMDAERAKLRRMGETLRQAFGANTIAGDSQIVPFRIGGDREAVEKANYFLENGFLVFAIRPPTVPPNGARLRFSLSAALPEESIEQLRRLI